MLPHPFRRWLELIAAGLLVAACAAARTAPASPPTLPISPAAKGTMTLPPGTNLSTSPPLRPATANPGLNATAVATTLSTGTDPAALAATPTAPLPPVASAEPVAAQRIPHILAGQPLTITTVHMLDSATGWAIARDAAAAEHLVRTTDGGARWHDVSPPETNFVAPLGSSLPANALADFLDANTDWIVYWSGSDQLNPVWRTRDGGQTWNPSSPIPPLPYDPGTPTRLTFIDAQTGWLLVALNPCGTGGCYDDILYNTADGGQTWQPVSRTFQGGLSTCHKSGVAFVSAQTGWVAGDCSMALVYLLQRTVDGGRTWQEQTLPSPPGEPNLLEFDQSAGCKAIAPVFSSAETGTLDLYCPYPKDYPVKRWLYITTDGGQTWLPRLAPTIEGAADFLDAQTGWWLGTDEPSSPAGSRLYQTSDGGQTWTLIKRLGWYGTLDFISPEVGWAVAQAGDSVALVKTVDGGRTWQELKPSSS